MGGKARWYAKDDKVMVQTDSYGASDGSTDYTYSELPREVKELYWQKFKERLAEKGEINLLGSVDSYEKIFMGDE